MLLHSKQQSANDLFTVKWKLYFSNISQHLQHRASKQVVILPIFIDETLSTNKLVYNLMNSMLHKHSESEVIFKQQIIHLHCNLAAAAAAAAVPGVSNSGITRMPRTRASSMISAMFSCVYTCVTGSYAPWHMFTYHAMHSCQLWHPRPRPWHTCHKVMLTSCSGTYKYHFNTMTTMTSKVLDTCYGAAYSQTVNQ